MVSPSLFQCALLAPPQVLRLTEGEEEERWWEGEEDEEGDVQASVY